MINEEYILSELNITDPILNIYPYGSRVYGTHHDDSDYDFIIVYKSGRLPNGAFRNNAISNKDMTIQGVCYSRGGFLNAIDNYEIGALECIFLPEYKIVKNAFNFKLRKFNKKEMVKKIISKASDSWHSAQRAYDNDMIDISKKGIFHALRILYFGMQLKSKQCIFDYSVANDFRTVIKSDYIFKPKHFLKHRDELFDILRSEEGS